MQSLQISVQLRLFGEDPSQSRTILGPSCARLVTGSPSEPWAKATTRPVDEHELTTALTTRTSRRVRKDGTLDIDGAMWQLDQGFLASAIVTVAVDKTGTAAPVVEHDGRCYVLRPVDAVAAGKTRRHRRPPAPPAPTVPFDPPGALLDRLAGRQPRHRQRPCSA